MCREQVIELIDLQAKAAQHIITQRLGDHQFTQQRPVRGAHGLEELRRVAIP